ncbi:MAG TPA: GNAT family N-acetyltransferase [Symbiobacteriaceae bacterium]|nr:GNAT family N-acetyltransferase [Symbiobacteriaceae bacterium]
MHFSIRPQVPDDYPGIGALEGETAEWVAGQAAKNPKFVGLVAVADGGQVLGRASAGFMHDYTEAGDMRCLVRVAPEHRRQGVGGALWKALLEAVALHRPKHLRANGDARYPEDVAWAERRGFAAKHHVIFQTLDLTALPEFDLTTGYRFVPFAELRSPEGERRLHAMFQEYETHTPDGGEWEYEPFDSWRTWTLDSENAWPEGWLVAIAPDGDWAGFTMAMRDGTDRVHTIMTGVAPAHRGQGLGFAMKVAVARLAAELGFRRLSTLNHAANKPILAINRRLGFQVEEDILRLVLPCTWE